MENKHKGLLVILSSSLLLLGFISSYRSGSNIVAIENNDKQTYTLNIDSSNCDLFKKGNKDTTSLVYTSLGNPIRLNKLRTKEDLELVNIKDALLLKGNKSYYSSIEIDNLTPFYSLLSIKINFEVTLNDVIQPNDRITFYGDSSSKNEHDLVNGVVTPLSNKNYRYFSIRPLSTYGNGERIINISSIVVEYSCVN